MSTASDPSGVFSDPAAVAAYAERPPRLVPGWADLQRMTTLLVAERTPENGAVLVVGAGGGLELKAMCEADASWRFTGVDPSSEMLKLAQATLGAFAARVQFHAGYMDTAPEGPFDAATCLLTLHFVPVAERLGMLRQIHRRLKAGAPFIAAHLSIPQEPAERAVWLARYVAFAVSSGVAPASVQNAATMIGDTLPIVSPAQDEALLREAGFSGTSLFYAGFTFRGWVSDA